jgi:hypothetical protein
VLGRPEHPGQGTLAEALLVGGVDLDGGGVLMEKERVEIIPAAALLGNLLAVVRWGREEGGDVGGVHLLGLHGCSDFLGQGVFAYHFAILQWVVSGLSCASHLQPKYKTIV